MNPISIRRGGGRAKGQQRFRLGHVLLILIVITLSFYAISIRRILFNEKLTYNNDHREHLRSGGVPSPAHSNNTSSPEGVIHGSSPGIISYDAKALELEIGTPQCHSHTKEEECNDFCQTVGDYVKGRRNDRGMWHWYYPNILKYYECINAKVVVEVGAAFGGQTQYMLKNGRNTIEEYHVVDPFMAGYDRKDVMSRWMQKAAPGVSPSDISIAWYKSISLALGTKGEYRDEGMQPAGCRLRMHRLKSVEGASLFANHSVDAVFIDGLHTYEGVVDDINAWKDKVKPEGALIFNDYNLQKKFGGISKAVKEEAARRSIEPFMIDKTNAVLGGKVGCATKPVPF